MHEMAYYIFPSENFLDLGLYQFGWEACESGHSFGPAKRNHYLFHYVISGAGTLMYDGEAGRTATIRIESGQGFLIFPGQTNTYIADAEDPWEYVWLEFDGLRVKHALDMAGFSRDRPVYRARSKPMAEQMREEMLYIAHHGEESPMHLIGHLYLFLDLLTRSAFDAKNSGFQATKIGGNKLRNFYIREAIAFIENNFQKDISVEDIADTLGINRSYFGKIFRGEVGKSPQQFLINYRMAKATELLTLTQKPVNEVGAAVGYANQMHFSRAFRTIYGISPKEWRKRNQPPGEEP